MSLELPQNEATAASDERPFALPRLDHVSPVIKAMLALALIAVLAGIGYLAATNYPREVPPAPTEVERQAALFFALPHAKADSVIVGDLLVERFYAVDIDTGEHYVADMLKGRIQGVQASGPNGEAPYVALLDLRNMQRDSALYAAFVDAVARPSGNYLGLRVLGGASSAFRLNYNGLLPEERRLDAHRINGQSPYEYLLEQKYTVVGEGPRLVNSEGYNYVLNNTDQYPFFRGEFRTGKALLLSELIIVDTTGAEQRATFSKLQERFKTTPAR